MKISFEWHEEKAKINLKKHQVSFEEAKSVFNDPFAITILDPVHSANEQRFIDLGFSSKGRYLVVCYTERMGNIRLISARKATKAERKFYDQKR